MSHKTYKERRNFLKKMATMSLLGSGMGAMGGKLDLIGSALAATGDYTQLNDYKALVCVFLYGGSDSFNMVVPMSTDAGPGTYTAYAASRGSLAVPRDAQGNAEGLLAAGTNNGEGNGEGNAAGNANLDLDVGFNPLLPNLKNLYDSGDLAIIRNAGNLIEPVTRADYIAGSNGIPPDLFAHNHQQEQWLKGYTSRATSLVGEGWGGRMADLLQDANQGSLLPPGFSVDGTDWWLPGDSTQPMRVSSSNGLSVLSYLDSSSGVSGNVDREAALAQMLALEYENPLMQQAGAGFSRAQAASRNLSGALAANNNLTTPYNTSSRLAAQLRMVARLIASRGELSMNRQIFFVSMGGWDTHDNQELQMPDLLTGLDRDLSDFYQTLVEMQLTDAVTTFTASDFGRTLTVNGDGSDHGWGGHYMTMGGAVNGGRMFGEWPSYMTGGSDDTGDKGRVIPDLSINQYGSRLASWMGVNDSDISEIFPDLVRFGDTWQSEFQLFS